MVGLQGEIKRFYLHNLDNETSCKLLEQLLTFQTVALLQMSPLLLLDSDFFCNMIF